MSYKAQHKPPTVFISTPTAVIPWDSLTLAFCQFPESDEPVPFQGSLRWRGSSASCCVWPLTHCSGLQLQWKSRDSFPLSLSPSPLLINIRAPATICIHSRALSFGSSPLACTLHEDRDSVFFIPPPPTAVFCTWPALGK